MLENNSMQARNTIGPDAVDEKQLDNSRNNGVFINFGGGNSGPLRVVFHAGLGTLNSYMLLLDHLDRQQLGPVIGISIKDIDKYCEINPDNAVEHIAQDYARLLAETGHKEVQLIGHCIGGLTAIEVARRLLERGVDVRDLAIVDSSPAFIRIEDDWILEILFVFGLGISLDKCGVGDINSLEIKETITTILNGNSERIPHGAAFSVGGNEVLDKVRVMFQKLKTMCFKERFSAYAAAMYGIHGENLPGEILERFYKSYNQSMKAAFFRPPLYMGDVRFFQAEVTFSFMPSNRGLTIDFWRNIVQGDFNVTKITGDHNTCIEKEPQLTYLSELIAEPLRA